MDMTRRQTLLAAAGLLLTGCSSATGRYDRPDPWTARSYHERRRPRPTGPAQNVRPTPPATPSTPAGLDALARGQWTRSGAIASKVNPMNGVSRITVHHEGSSPVYFADAQTTAARIELIRRVHTRDRGWGDIGYHYIIDRAGRVWEGRSLAYQGAHVRENNEHNVGVLMLGNFDKQSPTDAQMTSLHQSLATLTGTHRVGRHRVFTHQELVQTACPGRSLQGQMAGVRRHLA